MNPDPFIVDLIKGVAALVLVPVTLAFLVIAWRLLRVYLMDRSEYQRNQARSPSLLSVLRGEAPTFYDGVRDERVAAGVARDLKNNKWVEQGKLSEEAVSNVLN
jgi:hypothetical protein